jgi:hypothetical protein
MHIFRQAFALIAAALRSIPQRLGASLVTVIGITTVVGVLVTMLALGRGVEQLALNTNRADRVGVIAGGSNSSLNSALDRATYDKIVDKPGVKHDAQGRPIVAPTFITIIDGITRTNQRGPIGFFSAGPQWRQIWTDVHVVEGRYFQPGLHQLIVSQRIRSRFKGMDLGDSVKANGIAWKIVGIHKDTQFLRQLPGGRCSDGAHLVPAGDLYIDLMGIGAAIAWFAFNGDAVVTGGLNIHMAVTLHEVLVALCWAFAIALAGGFLPALRASGMPIATALRAS